VILFVCAGQCLATSDKLTLSLETPGFGEAAASKSSADTSSSSTPEKRQETTVRVGRVGIVAVTSAAIYQSRSANSPKFSTVKLETPLAIVKEEGDWYGILMVNGATGWISKHLVKLTGYELVADRSLPSRGSLVSRGGEVSRSTALADGVVRTAMQYSGVRYVFGGSDPGAGMDCSAFVRMVFGQYGVALPRTARDQAQVGASVPLDQLQPGDRLYFQCKSSYIDHCGIYAGNGYFVHCSASRNGVAVDSLASDFYWRSLVAARRS